VTQPSSLIALLLSLLIAECFVELHAQTMHTKKKNEDLDMIIF
jgi:hypothetical protein